MFLRVCHFTNPIPNSTSISTTLRNLVAKDYCISICFLAFKRTSLSFVVFIPNVFLLFLATDSSPTSILQFTYASHLISWLT